MQIQSAQITTSIPVPIVVSPRPKPRALRILHVVNGEYYAGAERVQDHLAMNLPGLGFEVGFACVKRDQFPSQRECQDAPLTAVDVRHPWHRRAIRRIASLVENGNYDLLHSHTPRSAWAALSAGRLTGRPVVHTMHDVSLGQSGGLARQAFNRYTIGRLQYADFVTTVSPESDRLSERLHLGKSRRMILNGVPAAREGFRRVMPKEWTLGTVGLIRPCKGIEVLIRAIARLRDHQCRARAVVVGTFVDEPYEREVMDLVESLSVGSLIDFIGFSSDVPGHLEKFDLFVMPSVGPEGLPMVLLEAMAHGLPTIGSDVPGVGDVLRPRVDGLLFPVGDDQALAGAVQEFVSGDVDWQSMSRTVQVRHEAEFSARRMAAEFADVYHRVDSSFSVSVPN